jgi:hypothetical protein
LDSATSYSQRMTKFCPMRQETIKTHYKESTASASSVVKRNKRTKRCPDITHSLEIEGKEARKRESGPDSGTVGNAGDKVAVVMARRGQVITDASWNLRALPVIARILPVVFQALRPSSSFKTARNIKFYEERKRIKLVPAH